jgi:hypothetical protein
MPKNNSVDTAASGRQRARVGLAAQGGLSRATTSVAQAAGLFRRDKGCRAEPGVEREGALLDGLPVSGLGRSA